MSLELPYGGKRTTAGPWDEYYGPYASVAAAKAAIPEAVRYDGLTVQITGTGEYHWLQADLSDTGLVAKTSGSSGWPLTGTASLTGDVNVNGNGTAGFQMGVTGTQPVDIKLWASNQVELFGQALAYITSFGTARIQADDNGGTVVHLELSNAGTGSLHATDGVNESEIIVSPSGITLVLGSDATGDTYQRNSLGYLERVPIGANTYVYTSNGTTAGWAAPSGGGLTVGTSTITSGTNTRVLYNNSGVLGEYTVSGSGNVAMTTSPTFTKPILGTPTSGTLTNTTGYLFNNLAAATGANTINNAANAQEWQWNTLGSGTGLLLSSSSTAAASNTNTVFRVNQTGANSTSTQSTYAGYFSNTKTGTSSTNYAGFFTASGGSTNYAIYATTGQSRIGDILFNSSASNVIQTSSSSTRLDLRGASGAVSLGIVLGDQQTYTGAGGMTALKNMMSWTSSSATSTFKSFSIAPTINVTSGTGTLYGLIYEPTLTSTAGLSAHYFIHASTGRVLLGGLPTSSAGLSTGELWNNSGVINIV